MDLKSHMSPRLEGHSHPNNTLFKLVLQIISHGHPCKECYALPDAYNFEEISFTSEIQNWEESFNFLFSLVYGRNIRLMSSKFANHSDHFLPSLRKLKEKWGLEEVCLRCLLGFQCRGCPLQYIWIIKNISTNRQGQQLALATTDKYIHKPQRLKGTPNWFQVGNNLRSIVGFQLQNLSTLLYLHEHLTQPQLPLQLKFKTQMQKSTSLAQWSPGKQRDA